MIDIFDRILSVYYIINNIYEIVLNCNTTYWFFSLHFSFDMLNKMSIQYLHSLKYKIKSKNVQPHEINSTYNILLSHY